jgi:hypothetical protein
MAQTVITQIKFKHTGNPQKIERGYGVGYLRGSINITASKTAYIKGWSTAIGSKSSYTSGLVRTTKVSYLKGSINPTSSKAVYLKGWNIGLTNHSAYIEGWSPSADTDTFHYAYLRGTGQELLPVQDITIDGFINEASGTTLYPSLADSSDSTYIWKDNVQTGDYFEVLLDVPTPLEAGNYYLRFRIYRKDGTAQANLKFELRQGLDTSICFDTQTTSGSIIEYSHQLTSDEIANITDWDDLRIRVTMMGIT